MHTNRSMIFALAKAAAKISTVGNMPIIGNLVSWASALEAIASIAHRRLEARQAYGRRMVALKAALKARRDRQAERKARYAALRADLKADLRAIAANRRMALRATIDGIAAVRISAPPVSAPSLGLALKGMTLTTTVRFEAAPASLSAAGSSWQQEKLDREIEALRVKASRLLASPLTERLNLETVKVTGDMPTVKLGFELTRDENALSDVAQMHAALRAGNRVILGPEFDAKVEDRTRFFDLVFGQAEEVTTLLGSRVRKEILDKAVPVPGLNGVANRLNSHFVCEQPDPKTLVATKDGVTVTIRKDGSDWSVGLGQEQPTQLKHVVLGLLDGSVPALGYQVLGLLAPDAFLALLLRLLVTGKGAVSARNLLAGLSAAMEPNKYDRYFLDRQGLVATRHMLAQVNLQLTEAGDWNLTSKETDVKAAAAWVSKKTGEFVLQTEDARSLGVIKDHVFSMVLDGDQVIMGSKPKHCFKTAKVDHAPAVGGSRLVRAKALFMPMIPHSMGGTVYATEAFLSTIVVSRPSRAGGTSEIGLKDSQTLDKTVHLEDREVNGVKKPGEQGYKILKRIEETVTWHVQTGDRVKPGQLIASHKGLEVGGVVYVPAGEIRWEEDAAAYGIVRELTRKLTVQDRSVLLTIEADILAFDTAAGKGRQTFKGMLSNAAVSGVTFSHGDIVVGPGAVKNTEGFLDNLHGTPEAVRGTTTMTVDQESWNEVKSVVEATVAERKKLGFTDEVVTLDPVNLTITWEGEGMLCEIDIMIESTTVAQAVGTSRMTLPSALLVGSLPGGEKFRARTEKATEKNNYALFYLNAVTGHTPPTWGPVWHLGVDRLDPMLAYYGDRAMLDKLMADHAATGLTLKATNAEGKESILPLFPPADIAGLTADEADKAIKAAQNGFRKLLTPDALGIGFTGYGALLCHAIRLAARGIHADKAQYYGKLQGMRADAGLRAIGKETSRVWAVRDGVGCKVEGSWAVRKDTALIHPLGLVAKMLAEMFGCEVWDLPGKLLYTLRAPMPMGSVLTVELMDAGVVGCRNTIVVNELVYRTCTSGDTDGDGISAHRGATRQLADSLKKIGALDPFQVLFGKPGHDPVFGLFGEVNDCPSIIAMVDKIKVMSRADLRAYTNDVNDTATKYRGIAYRMLEAGAFTAALGLTDHRMLHFGTWAYEHLGNAVKQLSGAEKEMIDGWQGADLVAMGYNISAAMRESGLERALDTELVAQARLSSALNHALKSDRDEVTNRLYLKTKEMDQATFGGANLCDPETADLLATLYRIYWNVGRKKVRAALADAKHWRKQRPVMLARAQALGLDKSMLFGLIDQTADLLAQADQRFQITVSDEADDLWSDWD